MHKDIDLVSLEKRVFKSTFADGLWDIMLGIGFLAFAIVPLLSVTRLGDFYSSLVMLPFFGIGWAVVHVGKQRITIPRAGMMKSGPLRRKKIAAINVYLNLILVVGIVIGFVVFRELINMDWAFPIIFSALILVSFSLGARYLDFIRLGWYGTGLTVLLVSGELLFRRGMVTHHGLPLAFGISGAAAIAIGVLLLLRFVKTHPVRAKEG